MSAEDLLWAEWEQQVWAERGDDVPDEEVLVVEVDEAVRACWRAYWQGALTGAAVALAVGVVAAVVGTVMDRG